MGLFFYQKNVSNKQAGGMIYANHHTLVTIFQLGVKSSHFYALVNLKRNCHKKLGDVKGAVSLTTLIKQFFEHLRQQLS
jgi:hypothetical protein